jgi:hypothetical protein
MEEYYHSSQNHPYYSLILELMATPVSLNKLIRMQRRMLSLPLNVEDTS